MGKRLAILPFLNLTGAVEGEWLRDGLAADVINAEELLHEPKQRRFARQCRAHCGPPPGLRHRWLAVSPDEEWILYAEQPLARSEIMLVEDFR